jgi:hypothetical protein
MRKRLNLQNTLVFYLRNTGSKSNVLLIAEKALAILCLLFFCKTDKAAEQGCRARLPSKTAEQGYRPRLPSKATGQGYRPRMPDAGQGCMQWCNMRKAWCNWTTTSTKTTTKQNLAPCCNAARVKSRILRIVRIAQAKELWLFLQHHSVLRKLNVNLQLQRSFVPNSSVLRTWYHLFPVLFWRFHHF